MIEFFEFDLSVAIDSLIRNVPYYSYSTNQVFGIPKEEYNKLNRISKDVKYVSRSRMLKIIKFNGWDIPMHLIKDTDIQELKPYVKQNMDFIRSHPELTNYT